MSKIKSAIFYGILCILINDANAAPAASAYIKPDTYNYMYPYMNNQMRTDLNPGVMPNQNTNPMDIVVRTTQMGNARRVVARPTNTARVATTTQPQRGLRQRPNTARTSLNPTARQNVSTDRRPPLVQNNGRPDDAGYYRTINDPNARLQSTEPRVSSVRCLADYTTCMDNYCKRENTPYNRCYCSAKLSQIDSTYQPTIDALITEILKLKNTATWTDAEMNEYWDQMVGRHTGDNSWINIDNALNIDWASMDSRVRGQTAFNTGHEYCVQHLRGCGYMLTNLRDAYRSEITRDCATYEQALQKIKNAAESIVESYK